MAPCRLALKVKMSCPKCRRPMNFKTLKYSHVCGRTWDVAERAAEEEHKPRSEFVESLASEAPLAREQSSLRCSRMAEPGLPKPKYSNLLAQIY